MTARIDVDGRLTPLEIVCATAHLRHRPRARGHSTRFSARGRHGIATSCP
ncbi:MAG: hypothetical protein ACLSVD_10405 [Eggerthellaceae bacterium]